MFVQEGRVYENSILLFYYIYLLYISFGIYVIYTKEGVCCI